MNILCVSIFFVKKITFSTFNTINHKKENIIVVVGGMYWYTILFIEAFMFVLVCMYKNKTIYD